MEFVLEAINLSKNYGATAALSSLNLSLPSGKIIGLLGPNGSGKSTLVKLAAGLLTPSSGEIKICGKPVGKESKALVSYLPDRIYFNPNQSINSLLDFFQTFYEDFDRQRAESMLTTLGLSFQSKFNNLSKGSKEKVQLCLVMSRRARLYLLDEPIAGVDPAARDFILSTIINNYEPEASILISTHLIADVEPILNEYLFLYNGQIMQYGSVDDMRAATGKSLDELFREVFRCLPSY